jgi:hypothetical protein
MRTAAFALILLAIAAPAAAQTTAGQDQMLENRVWAEQQLQQQQAQAAQREAYVAQQRAQTAAAIADLNARNAATRAQPPALAPLNPDIAAADAAMAKAQARILAESNARILQVTGGSR